MKQQNTLFAVLTISCLLFISTEVKLLAQEKYTTEVLGSIGEAANEIASNNSHIFTRTQYGISSFIEEEDHQLTLLSYYKTNIATAGFVINDQYIYLLNENFDLSAINVSTPLKMEEVSTISLPFDKPTYFPMSSFSIIGNYLYISFTSYEMGLIIVDISNPQTPVYVKKVENTNWISTITSVNNYLVTAEREGNNTDKPYSVTFWDLTNPTVPKIHSRVDVRNYYWNLNPVDNYIYLTGNLEDGYEILDISDLDTPTLVAFHPNEGLVINKASKIGNHLVACTTHNEKAFISVFSIDNPLEPAIISEESLPGLFTYTLHNNKILALTSSDDFIFNYELDESGFLNKISVYTALCLPNKFETSDNNFIVLSRSMAFIYSSSNLLYRNLKGTIKYSDFGLNNETAKALASDGNFLSLFYAGSAIHLYDISTPSSIEKVAKYPVTPDMQNARMLLKNKVLYLLMYESDENWKFEVINFASATPEVIYSQELNCWDLAFSEDKSKLYISFLNQQENTIGNSPNGIAVYNISSNPVPTLQEVIPTESYATMKEYEGILYVASNNDYPDNATSSWLKAYKTTSEHTQLASMQKDGGIWDIDILNGTIALSRLSKGLELYDTIADAGLKSIKITESVNEDGFVQAAAPVEIQGDARAVELTSFGNQLLCLLMGTFYHYTPWDASKGVVEIIEIIKPEPDKVPLYTFLQPLQAQKDGCSVAPLGRTMHNKGESVTITSSSAKGWKFKNFEGAGGGPTTTITMDESKTVTAVYERTEQKKLTMAVSPPEALEGGCMVVPSSGEHYYDKDAEVSINAIDNNETGWLFVQWTGSVGGSNPAQTVVMDEDKNATAHFVQIKLEVGGHNKIEECWCYYRELGTVLAVPVVMKALNGTWSITALNLTLNNFENPYNYIEKAMVNVNGRTKMENWPSSNKNTVDFDTKPEIIPEGQSKIFEVYLVFKEFELLQEFEELDAELTVVPSAVVIDPEGYNGYISGLGSAKLKANLIYNNQDQWFDKLDEAISGTGDNGTITLCPGIHEANVVLNKKLKITGTADSKALTKLKAKDAKKPILIIQDAAKGSSFESFTFEK